MRSAAYKILLIACFFAVAFSACMKDYSYEYREPAPPDIPTPPVFNDAPAICEACKGMDLYQQDRWSFKVGNVVYCGTITRGVLTPEKTGFTFFGPSACSEDTGLIMTIFVPNDPLTKDRFALQTSRSALQYYNRLGPTDVFASLNSSNFQIYIEQYLFATKYIIGRFSGVVYDAAGNAITIKDGKFRFNFS